MESASELGAELMSSLIPALFPDHTSLSSLSLKLSLTVAVSFYYRIIAFSEGTVKRLERLRISLINAVHFYTAAFLSRITDIWINTGQFSGFIRHHTSSIYRCGRAEGSGYNGPSLREND